MLRKRSVFGNLPLSQNVPSMARVAAGAFGFLIFSHALDGPDLYAIRRTPREFARQTPLQLC